MGRKHQMIEASWSLLDLVHRIAPQSLGPSIERFEVARVLGAPLKPTEHLGERYIRAPGGLFTPGRSLAQWSLLPGTTMPWRIRRRDPGSSEHATFRSDHAGLDSSADVEILPDANALVIATTIANNGLSPVSFRAVDSLLVELSSDIQSSLRLIGGGSAHEVYPPPQYAVHEYIGGGAGWEPIVIQSGEEGRSTEDYLPFAIGSGDRGGVVVGVEWSGFWRIRTHVGKHLRIHSSTIDRDGLDLGPGERAVLPRIHVVFFEGDLNDGTNAIRSYVRERVMPKVPHTNGPLVVYDHWFGMHADIDSDLLIAQADVAAKLGAEVFVLDAGWFPQSKAGDFHPGVGFWSEDLTKFPAGLETLSEQIRKLGLSMGLWFEVERAHHASPVVQAHPEWFLDIGADHLHIDFSFPQAQAWAIEVVSDWVDRLDLQWIRFDYNIEPRPYFESERRSMDGHLGGLYSVLDELLERHPQLHIEACASGGRRLDLGILRRSHAAWISDETSDRHICRFMQIGINHVLPAYLSGVALPIANERDGSISHSDVLARMNGAFLLSGFLTMLDNDELNLLRQQLEHYKALRHLLVGRFRRIFPHPRGPSDWDGALFVDEEGLDGALMIHRGSSHGPSSVSLAFAELSGDSDFSVIDLRDPSNIVRLRGDQLASQGVDVRLQPRESTVLRFVAS